MLTDYAAVGEQELWNTARLAAYLANVGSPFTTGADICGCATVGRQQVDPDGAAAPLNYDTPATDPAPWYDADLPVSGDFLGFMPLAITGLNDNPRARNVTNAVGGGGVLGPTRTLPRAIVVTGLLIGASCCGAEYGMHYLSEALLGCSGDECGGDCLSMFNCCPDTVLPKAQLETQHGRTFRKAALISGPTETNRVGSGSGTCARGACGANGDIIEVEFTLSSGAWPWTETIPLLDVALPIGGTGDCIDWCVRGPGAPDDCPLSDCSFAPCEAAADKCADPRNRVPRPPSPTVPEASFCIPLAPERQCYTISLANRPQWSSDVPMITVEAGSSDLRNVRISFYERKTDTTLTCEQIADAGRCNPQNDFVITYVPAGGSVTIDGQIGAATIECDGECQTASTVFGDQDGGPVQIRELTCAEYCVCLESDPSFPPAADSNVSIGVSGRGY